jgi:hypothetical protein
MHPPAGDPSAVSSSALPSVISRASVSSGCHAFVSGVLPVLSDRIQVETSLRAALGVPSDCTFNPSGRFIDVQIDLAQVRKKELSAAHCGLNDPVLSAFCVHDVPAICRASPLVVQTQYKESDTHQKHQKMTSDFQKKISFLRHV